MVNLFNFISNLDRNSQILLGLIVLIGFLLFVIVLINIFSTRKEKRMINKIKRNNMLLKKEIEKESENIVIPPKVNKTTEAISIKKEVVNELNESHKLVEDEMLEVLSDEEENDIDRLINDIKNNEYNDSFDLTEFEREQEETAIISYDELCRKAGVQKKVYVKQEEVIKSDDYEGKYRPSKVISPIYGVQK